MRFWLMLLAAGSTLVLAVPTLPAETLAQTRTRVTISPSDRPARNRVLPGSTRAAVPEADARFRSTGYDLPGMTSDRWSDPFYLPGERRSLGRRMPSDY